MDPLLIERWLFDDAAIRVIDEASVSVVRQRVRADAHELGLSEQVTGCLVNVASELGHNQLVHAGGGWMLVRPLRRTEVPGLEVVAADSGSGIFDPREAFRGRPATDPGRPRTSLGTGLAAVHELADETDFDIRIGEGTCVWARKFAEPLPRRRQVGVYGRACPGETISGDDGAFARIDGGLLVGVADGLGHGPLARDASAPAIESLRQHAHDGPLRILERCHETIQGTRGAVMAAAKLDEPGESVTVASVGNVAVHAYGPETSRRAAGSSFVLGSPGVLRKPLQETFPLGRRDALVLFTDGLSSRTDIEGELDILWEHPVVIAQHLVERFSRDNDDALVLVVR